MITDSDLTARLEPFDSFWEGPEDVETGYERFGTFYAHNYLAHVPEDLDARTLVISCGPGYFVKLLADRGYRDVRGIDSSAEKVAHARRRGLDCRVARVFEYLSADRAPFDLIVAEQEINHLTKSEILHFLGVARGALEEGGRLILHSINGANPLTGSESRAGNFDHYNSFTEYSLRQVLEHAGFRDVRVFPLDLYVFYRNPLTYAAMALDAINRLFFRLNYRLVGKDARIYTKKIGAVATAPGPSALTRPGGSGARA